MSNIQNTAKPSLIKLMQNDLSPLVDATARAHCAAWAVMYAMVYEQAAESLICSTQEERQAFCSQQSCPPRWHVFGGPFTGYRWHGKTWRRVVSLLQTPSTKIHITTMTLGNWLFHIVAGCPPNFNPEIYTALTGLIGISDWSPNYERRIVHDDDSADRLMDWLPIVESSLL